MLLRAGRHWLSSLALLPLLASSSGCWFVVDDFEDAPGGQGGAGAAGTSGQSGGGQAGQAGAGLSGAGQAGGSGAGQSGAGGAGTGGAGQAGAGEGGASGTDAGGSAGANPCASNPPPSCVDGNTRQTCASSTATPKVEKCPANKPVCSQGECVVCEKDSYRCVDNTTSQVCDGTAWQTGTSCLGGSTPLCANDGSGTCVGVAQISGGTYHTCALNKAGDVYCWGDNSSGQLGLGASAVGNKPSRPQRVPGLPKIKQLGLGEEHSCALSEEGDIWCWGNNEYLQVGASTLTNPVAAPTRVDAGATVFSSLAAGSATTCAIDSSQNLWCWGQWAGQAGNKGDSQTATDGPALVSPLESVKQVSLGYAFGCAMTMKSVWCWGNNDAYQLGVEGKSSSAMALEILPNEFNKAGDPPFQWNLTCGSSHSYVWSLQTATDKYLFWGSNSYKQMQDPLGGGVEYTPVKTPTEVDDELFVGGTDVSNSKIRAGSQVTAWFDSTELNLRSSSSDGHLGTADANGEIIHKLPNLQDVAFGIRHTCAWQDNGKAWCWGVNGEGQLGLGDTKNQFTPTEIKW